MVKFVCLITEPLCKLCVHKGSENGQCNLSECDLGFLVVVELLGKNYNGIVITFYTSQ